MLSWCIPGRFGKEAMPNWVGSHVQKHVLCRPLHHCGVVLGRDLLVVVGLSFPLFRNYLILVASAITARTA